MTGLGSMSDFEDLWFLVHSILCKFFLYIVYILMINIDYDGYDS